MEDFPKQLISPISAKLMGIDGNVNLEVKLHSFVLELEGYSEEVNTEICLDAIDMPAHPSELESSCYDFSINPSSGYIDGSIYFFSAHNPVDVSRIHFGDIVDGRLSVSIFSRWALEFEQTGFKDFDIVVSTHIKL
ncbi:hypothetical protein L4C34_17755 [Vibrio profundum]|uniref:hypothetical protein n=1 Tax=Vibrio profundum TaxID=2910247 RepID=UPI003D10E9A2